jgi:hypothetical protein
MKVLTELTKLERGVRAHRRLATMKSTSFRTALLGWVFVGAFLWLTPAACAATAEDAYIAARDAAIAKIKALEAKKGVDTADKAQELARADLEKRLQEIVGDLDAEGFQHKGALNLESLSRNDVGFGMLDGLRFIKGDSGPQIVVTTDGLLDRWLRAPADWWKKARKTPPGAEAALHDDDFFTQAVGSDATFGKTADIPITRPAGATFALALLGGWAQDIGPNPAQEIVVVLRKDRKTIIETGNAEKVPAIPACDAIWKAVEDARAKGKASSKMEEKGDADYRACIGREAPKQAFFPALIEKAQAIADRLAAAVAK